ncbi:MAG: yqfC [Clostridia bacterium]|jgi:sporulation protein YqfC|nr:yqfC [Clostridia bacterium]
MNKKDKKKWFKEVINKDRVKEVSSKFREVFSEMVDIPDDVTYNSSKITMIDNKNVLIEGYKNVVDYHLHYIKIRGNNIEIVIDGKNLDIKEITDEDLVITGIIYSVNFK